MKKSLFFLNVLTIIFLTCCNDNKDQFTRGIGVYPGRPSEDFSPRLIADNDYRNIARSRPVYQSSAYDYNLTSQLLTDGIISGEMPTCIDISTQDGPVPKNEREWLLDDRTISTLNIKGTDIWVHYEIYKGAEGDSIEKIDLTGTLQYLERKARGWTFTCSGSDDGSTWYELGRLKGHGLPGTERPGPLRPRPAARMRRKLFIEADTTMLPPSFTFSFQPPKPTRLINASFKFHEPVCYHIYRISLSAPCAEQWSFSALNFYNEGEKLNLIPSCKFNSSWMSAGKEQEWVYVDLGSLCIFDTVKLYWLNKAISGSILVSEDLQNWRTIAILPDNQNLIDIIVPGENIQAKGRYVKVLMNKSFSGENYILSEIEVYGSGGLSTRPVSGPVIHDNNIYLSGGKWTIQRSSLVPAKGEEISMSGFSCKDWIAATVPGTVLSSYKNAGVIPDPNYDDNQLLISESFFNSDFWYRNEFDIPGEFEGKKIWLNFDGINWKADVFFNGSAAGKIEGAFIRGRFDISSLIKPGERNAMAVLIHNNEHPGVIKEHTLLNSDKNGGVLGADNPTFHASAGWDWIPTIRGRNTGIWNDVYITASGPVNIEEPLIKTDLPLPDTSVADISIDLLLNNTSNESVSGQLEAKFGNLILIREVSLKPMESRHVKFDPSTQPELHLKTPGLWWPNGYGKQNLYNVNISFRISGAVSDEVSFKTGIREMTFSERNNTLNMYINGRRFIGRGGNWGFSESNLAYRGREYDAAVAYHADMNFTMIRNWVAQTADEEFFDACDRYGIMVWQDFCLANPADGPDPDDPAMFLRNAGDMIKRIRNHPSIAIYAGRNEGNPPRVIDTSLRSMVKVLHPGLLYISNSAAGVVSGGGPYGVLPARDYYLLYGYNKFHSERGMPNVMTFESLRMTLGKEFLWPQNDHWGIHDFTLEGAQSCSSYNQMVEKGFGPVKDAEEFTELAQWINYNGYRAMFEGRSKYRQGLLLWMSHPAWPSMVWQTYDYYLEPTAAYFGCKKASEPIHIQWNPVYDNIEVVNYNAGYRREMRAKAQIFNMDGILQWEKETSLDCREDSTVTCFKLVFPASVSKVHFIKLRLEQDGKIISANFYWRSTEDGNYQALRSLPGINIGYNTKRVRTEEGWLLTSTVTNATDKPALMIRLKVVGKKSGERILPVLYSDNYVSLMPGDQEIITMRLKEEDTRGEKPVVEISGFNLN